MPDAADLARHLTGAGAQYFGCDDGEPIRVQPVRVRQRPNSTLYEFTCHTESDRYPVIVKVPTRQHDRRGRRNQNQPVRPDRPRLFPYPDSSDKAELEFAAMCRIQHHFENLQDPRFGVVRMYGFLPEHHAVVMQALRHPNLNSLLMKENRLLAPFFAPRLSAAFHNAGAWLRSYHELPGLPHTRMRHVRREDFTKAVRQLGDFLEIASNDREFFRTVRQQIVQACEATLPGEFRMAMGHGDYAPRNILVGPDFDVRVFDTLARWQVPCFEDIAHFLMALKANRLQVFSRGLLFRSATIDEYEGRFLQGYFGEQSIPLTSVRLFECLMVLEKWASVVHGQAGGGLRPLARWRLAAWSRFLKRYLVQLISEIGTNDTRQREEQVMEVPAQ